MSKVKLGVKRLHDDAVIPKYAHEEGDSGFDLSCLENFVIQPHDTFTVSTGLAFEIPIGYEIQLRSRSGIAAKNMVTVLTSPGTIDANYKGEVKVLLINHSGKSQSFLKGMRICQAVLQKIEAADIEEIETLSNSERDDKGFGSSGLV
jgi:dUTP pyrophosphatase